MGEQDVQRAIVVLSSGRAGTSLLMQVLGALGMTLSEELIGGRYENPDGFFEDARIVELHRELLSQLGASPVLPLPAKWLEAEATATIRNRLRAIVRAELARTPTIWGFKDPRTCAFLPLWLRILNGEKVDPVFILALRDPRAVVSSFARIYSTPPELAELIWLSRTCDALQHSAADCYVLHYEDWFSRGAELAGDLLAYTGLDRFFSGDVAQTLAPVLKPNLNRAVHEVQPLRNASVRRLYAALEQCRGAEFDRARLMEVVKECREAMSGFSGWYLEAQRSAQHTAALKEQTASLMQQAGTAREEGAGSKAQSMLEEAKAVQANAARAAGDKKIRQLEEQVAAFKKEVAQLRQQAADRLVEQENHAKLLAEHNRLLLDARDLRSELDALRLERSRISAQTEVLSAEVLRVTNDRDNLRADIERMRTAAAENSVAARGEAARHEAERARLEQRIAELESARQALDAEIAGREREIGQLRAQLEARAELEERLARREVADRQQAERDQRLGELEQLLGEREQLLGEREREISQLQADLEVLSLQNSASLKQIRSLHEELTEVSVRERASAPERPARVPEAPRQSRAAQAANGAAAEVAATQESDARAEAGSAKAPPAQAGTQPKDKGSALTPAVAPRSAKPAKPVLARHSRLWRKLRSDPYQYFADSRFAVVRPLKNLFKHA